jgi:small-conductance mechanosensitive channel
MSRVNDPHRPETTLDGPTNRRVLRVPESLKERAQPTRQLMRRTRFRSALYCGLGAVIALALGSGFDRHPGRSVVSHLLVVLPAVLFVLLGVICVRSTASELDDLFRWRGGQTAGSAVRMMVTVAGCLLVGLATFDMLGLPVGHLLIGGAIAGVIVGIAAQQSLGNLFAGLVLLMARPFHVGSYVRVRSGALGGEFRGRVLNISLTYVTIATPEGTLKVPNSGILAASVGPSTPPEESEEPDVSSAGDAWGQTSQTSGR